jgi:hypothetical protein
MIIQYSLETSVTYGHSLNAIDGDGNGVADVMILAGGFSPLASNDVWITSGDPSSSLN